MKLLLIMGLVLLFTLSLDLPLYSGEIYRWIDENGVTHFAQDLGIIPEKYRGQVKGQHWEEEKPAESTKESQVQENAIIGWQIEENVNDPNEKQLRFTHDLCSERNHHIAKARETFPNEKNITKAWSMYYERFVTEDEKKRIPLHVSTDTDPCRKGNLNPAIRIKKGSGGKGGVKRNLR